jgi:phospholipid transport system substrate-binding protein
MHSFLFWNRTQDMVIRHEVHPLEGMAGRGSAQALALSRRTLARLVLSNLAMAGLAAMAAPARAAASAGGDPVAPVRRLSDALLAVMKQGTATPFSRRYEALAPVVDQVFDLETVLRNSIGLRWANLPADQRGQLAAVFRRYTLCSYVANFDSFSGQSFRIVPSVRQLDGGQVVVQTSLIPTSGAPTDLSYVMQQTDAGWRIVDVLAEGSISRVATQRSDFRGLLSSGGVSALAANLERKVADLSGGALTRTG